MKYVTTTLLSTAVLLTGCGKEFNGKLNPETRMYEPETGVVIANTKIVGDAVATDVAQQSSDCEGTYGYGVEVETVQRDSKYLFDKDGMPCDAAVKIYDGQNPVHTRGAVPSIRIQFKDVYGTVDNVSAEDKLVSNYAPAIMTESSTPESFALNDADAAVAQMKGAQVVPPLHRDGLRDVVKSANPTESRPGAAASAPKDAGVFYPNRAQGLGQTVNEWKSDAEYQALTKNAEKLLAGVRDLQRLSSNELLAEHQNQLKDLMVQLRESQRMNEYYQERQRMLQTQLTELQLELDAKDADHRQAERKLEREAEVHEQETTRYKMIAHSLKEQKDYAEQALKAELTENRRQVHEAEKQADYARQRMIYEAAVQISEAEVKAKEAMMAQRTAMEREVARRSIDAQHLAHRAMDLEAGRAIVLPAMPRVSRVTVGEQAYDRLQTHVPVQEDVVADVQETSIVMEDLVVSLRVEDETLNGVFEEALGQLSDRIDFWEVVWNLEEKNRSIADESWSVLAETTFGDFLAYVQQKVADTHGVSLEFRRFDGDRLFVITDAEAPSAP